MKLFNSLLLFTSVVLAQCGLEGQDFSYLQGKRLLSKDDKVPASGKCSNLVHPDQLPELIRVVKPGEFTTKEYICDRLTINVDDAGVIETATVG